MSNRRLQAKVETDITYNKVDEFFVECDKVALVDADILYYLAMQTLDENEPLNKFKEHLEKIVIGFENTLRAKAYLYFVKGFYNFRNAVATIKPYKGNRKSEPHKYAKELYDHLVLFRDCIKSDHYEADDMLSIFHSEKTVVCTSDKDALQNPGSLYNIHKKTLKNITYSEAKRSFWMQMLTGDSVDNIPGLEGCGPKTASKYLDEVNADHLDTKVLALYKEKYGENYMDVFNENYQLLRMKTKHGAYIQEKYADVFLLIDYLYGETI